MRWDRVFRVSACLLIVAAAGAMAQESSQDQEKPAWFFAGPRVGATGVLMDQGDFDDRMQGLRSRDVEYFPVYSQFGFGLEQRVRLDDATAVVFRELGLVGGADQNLALFTGTLLAGIRRGSLEITIGPEVGLDWTEADKEDDPDSVASLVVAVTWVFDAWGRSLPVSLVAVPLWGEWEPRFTVLVGLDFPIRLRRAEETLPFNY